MANDYYTSTATPTFGSAGSSVTMRNEFKNIEEGFSKIGIAVDTKADLSEVESARGSASSLAGRLSVSLNADGSLKGTVTTSAEWVNPSFSVVYVSPEIFRIVGVDATGIMVRYRRLRLTVNGSYVYSEVAISAFDGNDTIVDIVDSVVDTPLNLVEYSAITPISEDTSTISYQNVYDIIDSIILPFMALFNSFTPIEVNTSLGPIVRTLPTNATHASYIKTTADSNAVTFITSDGSTFAESGLSLDTQYGRMTFDKVGTVWYRA